MVVGLPPVRARGRLKMQTHPPHKSTRAKRWLLALLDPGYKLARPIPGKPVTEQPRLATFTPGPQLGSVLRRAMDELGVDVQEYRHACLDLRRRGYLTRTRVGWDTRWALAPADPVSPPPVVHDA